MLQSFEIRIGRDTAIKTKKSDVIFEILGIIVGLSASVFILLQVFAEWSSPESSLSLPFLIGFMIIYLFWAVYGIIFKRIAIGLTNATAALLQMVLIAVVLFK